MTKVRNGDVLERRQQVEIPPEKMVERPEIASLAVDSFVRLTSAMVRHVTNWRREALKTGVYGIG